MFEGTSGINFVNSLFYRFLQILSLLIATIYIIRQKYSTKQLLLVVGLNVIGIVCYISSGLSGLFMTLLAITLLPKNSLDDVLNLLFKEELIFFSIIVILSLVGVLNNTPILIDKGSYIVRAYPFGFGHPNMLAAQGESIIFLYLCIHRNNLKIKHLFMSIIWVIIVYIFARGRTALYLGIVVVGLITFSKNKMIRKNILRFLPMTYCIILIIMILSMLIFRKYGAESPIVKIINDSFFNGRIGLAYRSLMTYPITLFGHVIDLSIWNKYQYFVLDNGQVMVLLEYGIIGFILYFYIFQHILDNLKQNDEIILAIITIAFLIWSMFEGTMYFIGKNFTLLFFINVISNVNYTNK